MQQAWWRRGFPRLLVCEEKIRVLLRKTNILKHIGQIMTIQHVQSIGTPTKARIHDVCHGHIAIVTWTYKSPCFTAHAQVEWTGSVMDGETYCWVEWSKTYRFVYFLVAAAHVGFELNNEFEKIRSHQYRLGFVFTAKMQQKKLAQINHELWAHSQPTIFHKNPSLSGGNGGTSAGSHDVTHLATRTMGKARGVFENKVPHSMIFHPTVKKLKWLFFCKKHLDVPH